MKLFTIGFTKSSAEHFFARLRDAGVRKLVDVRLNNVSQLAGFTKKDDLAFFVRAICDIPYEHRTDLAPTQDILDQYKKEHKDWDEYERCFASLLRLRSIEKTIKPTDLEGACLLCSEDTPDHCHRRVVAEYLRNQWGKVEIVHL